MRAAREKHGIHIGLHTSSAVNVAEYAPHASTGVDEYLKAYVDIYPQLGAEWIVMHAGFHFTKDRDARRCARRLTARSVSHPVLAALCGFASTCASSVTWGDLVKRPGMKF